MKTTSIWPLSISVRISEDMEERIRDLEANGIRYMELTASEITDFDDYEEKSLSVFETARAHGLKIRSVHLPFAPFSYMDPASTDPGMRERFTRAACEIIKISAKRGAELLVVHPSAEPYDEDKRAEHLRHSIESMCLLNDAAKREGVKLAVENLPRTCICRDSAELEVMKNALPDVFFCFDSNHSLRDDNTDIIKTMGDRIIALHISDYDFINERHLFPGEGLNDWNAIIRALEDVGYTGTWNYEIKDSAKVPASAFVENYQKLF